MPSGPELEAEGIELMPAVELPEISVVVPVLNGARTLPILLEGLARQTVAPKLYETLVVDNGSTDASAEVARRHGAVVVVEPVRGHAPARNKGLEAARGRAIACIDADCEPEPTWLDAILRCLADAPIVAGRTQLVLRSAPNRWERLDQLWRFREGARIGQGWAPTANLAFRREVVETIGGFDRRLRRGGEDVDFCLRARAAGFELASCSEAVVRHAASLSGRSVLGRALIQGYASNVHAHRWPGVIGLSYWRHPRPAIVGDHALGRFGEAAAAQRDLLWPARAEYAGRVIGSVWAELVALLGRRPTG